MYSEYDAMRREIEVRLMRETIYKAVNAFIKDTPISADEIRDNDEIISWIGKFLLDHGSEWEKVYAENSSASR